nr:sterile alpha motif domain-containing protein 1-like [Desmodus rotundus]
MALEASGAWGAPRESRESGRPCERRARPSLPPPASRWSLDSLPCAAQGSARRGRRLPSARPRGVCAGPDLLPPGAAAAAPSPARSPGPWPRRCPRAGAEDTLAWPPWRAPAGGVAPARLVVALSPHPPSPWDCDSWRRWMIRGLRRGPEASQVMLRMPRIWNH